MMKKRMMRCALSAATIDELSELCVEAPTEARVDRRDIIRLRLSLEDILGLWLPVLGEGAPVMCRVDSRIGQQFIEVRVEGERMDVVQLASGNDNPMLFSSLLTQAGLNIRYMYRDGRNCLTIVPPKASRRGQLTKILIAIAAAFALGGLSFVLPPVVQRSVQAVVDPLFETIMDCLRAISSPMIFLSVCWSITSIGDLSVVGVIGKRVISRMALFTLLVAVLCVLGLVCFSPSRTAPPLRATASRRFIR